MIPVKDEEESIGPLGVEIGEALAGLTCRWETLWVDDGSRDGSLAALERLASADPRNRYLSFERNYGQSAALLAGFREARGAVVATLDADLQNDPVDIPRLLEEMESRNLGMVNGVRARRRDRLVRRISSRIANAVRNRLTDETVTDVGCSIRVMRREWVHGLPSFRGMHRFLPTLVRLRGGSVGEIRVSHRPRAYGRTKYGINNRLWVGLLDLFGVCWLKHRWVEPRVRVRGGGQVRPSTSTDDRAEG